MAIFVGYRSRMSKDSDGTRAVQIRVTQKWLDGVNEWRRQQPDIPNISESIRRLVELGIAAQKKRPGRN
jgi:hypothetical protein